MDAYLELAQPVLTLVSFLLAERHVDQRPIIILHFGKRDHVGRHVAEVLFRVFICAGTQSLKFRVSQMATE